MIIAVISWFILSLIVGFMGSGRKIGFFGGFMLSLLVSPLIGFIIVIASPSELDVAVKKKYIESESSKSKPLKPKGYKPHKKIPIEKSKAIRKGVDLRIYQNNFGIRSDDMSHLSPTEARRELGDAKDSSDFLPSGEYYGLIDVIAGAKDEKYLDILAGMNDKETYKWFESNMQRDIKMSSLIWEEVSKVVAPIHEIELLEKLDKVTIGRVDGWVRERKREGMFFTDAVYEKALKIRVGEIENRKS